MTSDLLRIYMQDHYAGSAVGSELAKRAASNNADSELGTVLDRIAAEVGEDRNSLRRIMDEYGASPDLVKNMAAWGIEKAGRFKPNGRLLSYSPLSRVVELEGLIIGISGKLGLWRSLAETLGPHYAGEDLAALADRAEAQRQTLEPYRLAAVREAFAATVQGS